MQENEPKREYEIKNDYSYATGRARALEAKIKEPELMGPEQVLKEYGLAGKDIDASLEELMQASLREFEESAPDAVEPFRLMADLENMKAFIRNKRMGASIPYSALSSFEIPETKEELAARLREKGHVELADKLGGLFSMRLGEADLSLENHFTGRIKNPLFLEYIELLKSYLKSDEAPAQFYLRLLHFIKERYTTKNMGPEVATGFLLLRQRELAQVRAKAIKALLGG